MISELFTYGGVLKMTLISILSILNLVILFRIIAGIRNKNANSLPGINLIPVLGMLAYLLPVLLNSVALYFGANAIEKAGDISWTLFAGGIKMAIISEIYGLVVCIISIIAWAVLKEMNLRNKMD